MKVYVILHYLYELSHVYGVVEDEHVAKETVRKLGYGFGYKEFDTRSIQLDQDFWYGICFNKNGIVYDKYYERENYDMAEEDDDLIKINDKCWLVYDEYDGDIYMTVKAKDIEQATKIAFDMREKYLAEKAGL